MAPSSFELSAPAGPTAVTGRPPSAEAPRAQAPLDAFALLRQTPAGREDLLEALAHAVSRRPGQVTS